MTEAKDNKLSRRQFSKISAAAGFAVVAGRTESVYPDTAETLKVGLLGCGGRGTGAAKQILEGNENVKVTALADLFPDRTERARRSLISDKNEKIRKGTDVDRDQMFSGWECYKDICASDIDILIIATIPYCKPQHFEAAAAAGKHVFCEKPVATDPAGIRQFVAAAKAHKAKGLSLVAGTQRRHERPYVETIDKIKNGAIGEVTALRAYWCGGTPWVHERKEGMSDGEYRIRNWYHYCWACGDNIVEQHVHNLDVCNWIMDGPPVSVLASGGRNWKPLTEKWGDIYDHFSCDFEYENGVHMTSLCRHWDGCDGGVFEQAIGATGRSNCHDMGENGLNPYVQEHIDLVNSIRGTGDKWHQGIEVADSTMTAIMGRMSAYTGQKVTFEEAMKSDLSIVPENLSFDAEIPVGPVPVPVAADKIR